MNAKLAPVVRHSVSDSVFEQLRDQIVSGQLQPGVALPGERALSDMLGVNRGAVREALKRLDQARLVSIQHGGSTRVSDFKKEGRLDLLAEMLLKPDGTVDLLTARSVVEMRSLLAPDIMRLCALRATDEIKSRIFDVAEQMKAHADGDVDLSELQRLSMEFWAAGVEGSQNVAYQFAFNTLRETYSKIADLMTNVLEAELTDYPAYTSIAKAIDGGNEKLAAKRARTLIDKGAAGITQLLGALEGQDT